MNRFVIGDIHGTHRAMIQCLERSMFNYNDDLLICLGDVCDGYPETPQCFDELLKIKNMIFIKGNHTQWLLDWMLYGNAPKIWTTQGGMATIEAYYKISSYINPKHVEMISNGQFYYELDNFLFVHGGLDVNQKDIAKQDPHKMIWDRQLLETAWSKKNMKTVWKPLGYDKIFIGHTTTQLYKKDGNEIVEPIFACNVIGMDTGAGYNGKLSIMDIDTFEYWQSDFTPEIYGGLQGR